MKAKIVAEYLGTNHTEVLFTPQEGFNAIPRVIRVLESYDITTIRASVGMFLLAEYIAKNTTDTVIFSGEGSDELLCGYLYFHYAPTPEDAAKESKRLLDELYIYDVLRADRTISANGLELRVPFLDKDLVNLVLSLQPKLICPKKGFEKYLLRCAFSHGNYLPECVLWRRKDGMSDAISSLDKPWYKMIQGFVEEIMPYEYPDKYPSKEAYYYRKVFNQIFPTYQPEIPYWMPRWTNAKDPSGRVLDVYDEKNDAT